MARSKKAPTTEQLASVTSIAPWIAETNHRRRFGKLKKFSLTLLITTAIGGGAWLIVFSDYLALHEDQIEVTAEPDTLVDLDAIRELANQHKGTPLARVRTTDLATRAGELPAVKHVEVSRVWPNGLTVAIESRVPAAAVVTEAGFNWVDDSGALVRESPESGEMVKLEGPADQPRVLADMVTVWQALTPELQSQVRVLRATTTDNISAILHSGQQVQWGSAEQLKLKIATALALLDRAPNSQYFDVSSPSLPITR